MTRENVLWTGFHATAEKLVVLGIATQQARFLVDRPLWVALPGGMPYVVVSVRPGLYLTFDTVSSMM